MQSLGSAGEYAAHQPTQEAVDEEIVTPAWVHTSVPVWQVAYWLDSEAQRCCQGVQMSKRLANYPLVVLLVCSSCLWPPPGRPAHYWEGADDLQMTIKEAANLSFLAKLMMRLNIVV